LGVTNKEDSAIVGDVKPFMAVGGPGIGGCIVGGGGPAPVLTLPAWRQTRAGALATRRNADDAVAAEAEHGKGFEQGDVSFLADEDGEAGGGEEAEGFDIVAVGGQQRVAGSGKAAAGDEAEIAAGGGEDGGRGRPVEGKEPGRVDSAAITSGEGKTGREGS
jgi:hypothetical protein